MNVAYYYKLRHSYIPWDKWKMNRNILFKIIDILGKLLLGWYAFSTIRFYYSGKIIEVLNGIRQAFNEDPFIIFLYLLLFLFMSGFSVFLFIPLLWRGKLSGFILSLMYWAFGFHFSPLWVSMSEEKRAVIIGNIQEPMITYFNLAYLISTLLILVLFYINLRTKRTEGIRSLEKSKLELQT